MLHIDVQQVAQDSQNALLQGTILMTRDDVVHQAGVRIGYIQEHMLFFGEIVKKGS
ncbi:hypothetical protein [Paenibacillus sp. AR247]|uniref:hypothetical protein n=1 Tax=Paenibacillus sp. AR247 TaxID=1631599 RepID=UPI0015E341C6|nr:hypothetical protein [Paenibacillus sp. AR247]